MKTQIWISKTLPYKRDDENRVLYNSLDELVNPLSGTGDFTKATVSKFSPTGNKMATVNVPFTNRDDVLLAKRVIVQVENNRKYLYFVDSVSISNTTTAIISLSLDVFGTFLSKNSKFTGKDLYIKRMHNNRYYKDGDNVYKDFRPGSVMLNKEISTDNMKFHTVDNKELELDLQKIMSNTDSYDLLLSTVVKENDKAGFYYAILKPDEKNFNDMDVVEDDTRFPFFIAPICNETVYGKYVKGWTPGEPRGLAEANQMKNFMIRGGDNVLNIIFSPAPLFDETDDLVLVSGFGNYEFYCFDSSYSGTAFTAESVFEEDFTVNDYDTPGNDIEREPVISNSHYTQRLLENFSGETHNIPVNILGNEGKIIYNYLLEGGSLVSQVYFYNTMGRYALPKDREDDTPLYSFTQASVAPSSSDAYQQWMNRSSASYNASRTNNAITGAVGSAGGVLMSILGFFTANPVLMGAGLVTTATSLASTATKANALSAQKKDMQKTSGAVKNASSDIFSMLWNFYKYIKSNSGLRLFYKQPDPLSIKQIVSYHKEYGYENNKFIKVSNWDDLLLRNRYNYLKIDDIYNSLDISDIPVDISEDINKIFETGIRIWDNEDIISDYDTNNIEKHLEEV